MNPNDIPELLPAIDSSRPMSNIPSVEQVVEAYEAASPVVRNRILARLVVDGFESASPVVRRRLLERLLRPLGVLSLVAVAGGIFAKIPLRSNWQYLQVRIEDVQNVRSSDLIALVDHVQQVSVEAVTGVALMIASSPLMASSAAAVVLGIVLVRHSRMGRPNESDDEDFPAAPT